MRKHLRPLVLFACITAATALGSQIASADTGTAKSDGVKCSEQHFRHGHHRGDFLKRIAKELGMTEQQKSQAKAIIDSNKSQNKALFQEMMSQRHQLRSMIISGTADEAAIRAQSGKVASVQAELAVRRAKEARELRALLSPDQAEKLKTILEKREQKFRKFRSDREEKMR